MSQYLITCVVLLCGVAAVSLAVLAVSALRVVRLVHRFSERVSARLPACDEVLGETHRAASQARHLLTRASATTDRVARVVDQMCQAASGLVEDLAAVRGTARAFLKRRFGNGVRAGVRRHDR